MPSTTSPSPHGSARMATASTTTRWMQVGQHVITAVLVAFGTVRSLMDGAPEALVIAVAVAFIGWYAGGLVLATRTANRRGARWWLIGLAVIWTIAVIVSAEFVWLAFSLWLIAGHVLRWRWAVLFSIAAFAVVALAPILHHGATTYANIIGPLVGGVFALGISRGYTQLLIDDRERQQLVASLMQTQAEMADLHEELAQVQRESGAIDERTRLSRDIHDTIAQGFSSISLLARGALDGATDDPSRTLEQIESLSRDSLVDVRRIVAALAPADLDEAALPSALRRILDRLADETELETHLTVDDDFPTLPTSVEVALLRAAQSALANVRLHSGASRVDVTLADVRDSIRLDIADDGRGFDLDAWEATPSDVQTAGYGLHSMRARLRELGGGLDVESTPGEGTALSAHVPYSRTTEGS